MTSAPWNVIKGLRVGPVAQACRARDGVRGLLVTRSVPRGALLLEVPRRYCYLPRGLSTTTLSTSHSCVELRRLNRVATLFPETWCWMQRLSPDAREDTVSLEAHVSVHGDVDGPVPSSVVSISLTPVEAALCVAVATRFFYAHGANLSARARTSLSVGAAPSLAADAYVETLPFRKFLAVGVEDLFATAGGAEAHAHGGLEQLAHNLRDAVLSHASHREYSLIDNQLDFFDEVMLTAVYIIRARCLPVRYLVAGTQPASDRVAVVFAPALDSINHGGPRSTAQAALYGAGVVVRAAVDLRCGDEITVDYGLTVNGASRGATHGAADVSHLVVADDWEEGRYMLNMRDVM